MVPVLLRPKSIFITVRVLVHVAHKKGGFEDDEARMIFCEYRIALKIGQKKTLQLLKVELDEIVHCSSSVAAATSLHLCTATTTTGTERNAGE